MVFREFKNPIPFEMGQRQYLFEIRSCGRDICAAAGEQKLKLGVKVRDLMPPDRCFDLGGCSQCELPMN